jgi:hypothetical protein
MNSFYRTFIPVLAACALSSSYAVAKPPSWAPAWGYYKKAPGPVIGAGLPFLLIVGGYALVRRYRNRGKAE